MDVPQSSRRVKHGNGEKKGFQEPRNPPGQVCTGVCLYVYDRRPHVCMMLQRPKEGVGNSGPGVSAM